MVVEMDCPDQAGLDFVVQAIVIGLLGLQISSRSGAKNDTVPTEIYILVLVPFDRQNMQTWTVTLDPWTAAKWVAIARTVDSPQSSKIGLRKHPRTCSSFYFDWPSGRSFSSAFGFSLEGVRIYTVLGISTSPGKPIINLPQSRTTRTKHLEEAQLKTLATVFGYRGTGLGASRSSSSLRRHLRALRPSGVQTVRPEGWCLTWLSMPQSIANA